MKEDFFKTDSNAMTMAAKGFVLALIGGVLALPGDFFNIAPLVLLGGPLVFIGTLMGVAGVVIAWFTPTKSKIDGNGKGE